MRRGPFDLSRRVALVTGSTAGLGKAMAFALGAAGAKVALNYVHDEERAERTFAEFDAAGHSGALFRASATDESSVHRLFAEIGETLGAVDVVVVNASSARPQRPIEKYDWAHYQAMLDFFVRSPFLLARAALPHMKRQRWGRIINITSEVIARGVGSFSAYVAAKGAQDGWTRSMATELAPFGITVNMLAPGWIPVERDAEGGDEQRDEYRDRIPMDRWGVPEDCGGAAVFLASDAAGFITGQSIHINGGMTVG
jgi:3-oxoacyl-[acyl-carrier protein] reductase